MFSLIRTVACIASLLLASTVSVFASSPPLYLMISPGSEQVVTMRYMTGTKANGTWKEVDITHPLQLPKDFDSEKDLLFIQQKDTNQDWSSSYIYRYEEQTNNWLPVVIKSLFIDSIDLRRYALFPAGSSSPFYSIVNGDSIKLNLRLDEDNSQYGYCETGYSHGPAKTDWVDTMQAVNISAGMGYRFKLNKNLEITPELGYGLVLHILYGDLDQDGLKTYETYLDQQVRLSVNLGFAPTASYELFIAPLGVLFFEKDRVVPLYGLQAGIRFNL